MINTFRLTLLAISIIGCAITIISLPRLIITPYPIMIIILIELVGFAILRDITALLALFISLAWGLTVIEAGMINQVATFINRPAPAYFEKAIGLVSVLLSLVGVSLTSRRINLKNNSFSIFALIRNSGQTEPENRYPLVICKECKTKYPVEIKHLDRYLHTMVVGPTGSGKTSKVLKPMVYQDLKRIADGEKIGVTIIDPKGDFADSIAGMCREMGVSYVKIDPEREDTAKFNPLIGDMDDVAETMRTVMRSTFGQQEPFFSQVQETVTRNIILLLKELRGDDVNLLDVARALRTPQILCSLVQDLEAIKGKTDLVQYFRAELLGSLAGKYELFTVGIRQMFEDMLGNRLLRRVFIGETTINLDKHLSSGGVLIVNTAMGRLGRLGDIFGQLIILSLQHAVFRRSGNEWNRTPHFLYIDEFQRFANPDFERLITMGRSYRCACTLAMQNLAQLKVNGRRDFYDIILNNARNKIVFGGSDSDEAKRFEIDFGAVEVKEKKYMYDSPFFHSSLFARRRQESKKWEPRFNATYLQELKNNRVIYRIVRDGTLQPPGVGIVKRLDDNLFIQPVVNLNKLKRLESNAPVEENNVNQENVQKPDFWNI